MELLTIRLFGGFEARLSAGPPLILPTKKAQALLAHLALRPGEPHPRDKVAALLWGDKGEEQARHSLRQAISAIRKALSPTSPSCLVLEGNDIALAPSAVEVDAVLFEKYVGDGSPSALEKAVALYKGHFLEGLDVKEEMFEEWLMTERERLRELALDASAKLLSHQLKTNLDEAAIQTALRLLGLDPLQEGVHQILMRLYFKNGRRGAALMQYQRCVEVLQRELGVEPEPGTKQCYQEILQRASGTVPADIPQVRPSPRPRRRLHRARPDYRRSETPLIGREPELVRLRQAMEEARKGRGQTIAILGEAGIGKSRVIQEITTSAVQRGSRVLLGRCYETEQILPFGPWVDAIRTGQVIPDIKALDGLPPVWRAELARLFPELGEPALVTGAEDYRRLFEAVAQVVEHLAARRPLLLILEDLHWADEMSLRLFSFLARRAHDWPVATVATAREEELAGSPLLRQVIEELQREPHFKRLALSPLSKSDTIGLVRALARPGSEETTVATLAEKLWAVSEGNPFLVVESMQSLQEGTAPQTPSGLALPERVREIIAGRLERLTERSRHLVAVAAVIGREFDYVLLERAAALGERETAEGVEEMVRRRVLRGLEERFDFTHDRIREVAYAQILPPRRKLLHGLVAKALEEVYAENLEPHYAALGVHYRMGGVWERAVVYLHKAGVAAVRRSAHRDAITYFEQALESLEHLPENRQTLEQAINIRVDLGPALIAIRGFTVPEVKTVYSQAREMCERLGDTPQLFPVLWGLSRVYNFRGEAQSARELGEQLLTLAQRVQDPALVLEAHHTLWATLFTLGEFTAAQDHSEQGIEFYDPQQHAHHASLYGGHDPGVCCRTHAARQLWLLGYPDRALQRSQDALALAQKLSHSYSLTFALYYSAWVHQQRGERHAVQERIEAIIKLATERGFSRWVVQGAVLQGWLLAQQGKGQEGILKMRQGGTVAVREHAHYAALLAEAYGNEGQAEKGLGVLSQMLATAHKTGMRFYEAELVRTKGELLLSQAVPDEEEAEGCFRQALDVARSQRAKSLELRAAMNLSRLWQRQGKKAEARQLLSDIYGWFTEGFDTADLKAAKALLEELR